MKILQRKSEKIALEARTVMVEILMIHAVKYTGRKGKLKEAGVTGSNLSCSQHV